MYVTPDALYVDPYDPDHSFGGTTDEIFGSDDTHAAPAPMNGFVATNSRLGNGSVVMRGFTPDRIPIMATLANEFALFDRWFCSVPGPTNPNRRFLHAATADGSLDDADYNPQGFTARTIFDELNTKNVTWGVYYSDWSPSCMFQSLRTPENAARFYNMSKFYDHLSKGVLPQYAFIEPRMFATKDFPENDMHPDADVREVSEEKKREEKKRKGN